MRGLLVSQIQRGPERAVETLQLLASGVLPLFCLAVGDVGQYASQAFCHQDVAADGAYSYTLHRQNDFVSLDLEQICSFA